jgi:uncharacterized membrane protein (DUF2068 family)
MDYGGEYDWLEERGSRCPKRRRAVMRHAAILSVGVLSTATVVVPAVIHPVATGLAVVGVLAAIGCYALGLGILTCWHDWRATTEGERNGE